MMKLEEYPVAKQRNVKRKCSQCGGSGVIRIYRSDWEDFDEIPCIYCNNPSREF